jgi:hypothetical protein
VSSLGLDLLENFFIVVDSFCPDLFQLKSSHLVPVKAPLPEEAIFKRNQAAADRRRAKRKEWHKEKEIAKRDRNDNCIQRRKAEEHHVSSNEDLSPSPPWSGDEPSAEVDSSGKSGSPLPSSRRSDQDAHEKGAGSSSRPGARPAREDRRVTRSQVIRSQVPRPCAWCVYIVRVLVCATHRSISSISQRKGDEPYVVVCGA